jgi:hypothetical protein
MRRFSLQGIVYLLRGTCDVYRGRRIETEIIQNIIAKLVLRLSAFSMLQIEVVYPQHLLSIQNTRPIYAHYFFKLTCLLRPDHPIVDLPSLLRRQDAYKSLGELLRRAALRCIRTSLYREINIIR